uniref:Alkyl transferase n=1 Tax=Amblyomma maculatum TaxID=34609 RepID=G3MS10_AMBMU
MAQEGFLTPMLHKSGSTRSTQGPCRHGTESSGQLWDDQLPWYKVVVLWLLRFGPIPSHIAVMPDGNRRYAERTGAGLEHTYSAGTRLFTQASCWSFEAGVNRLTAFAFAPRHQKRNAFERDALFCQTIGTLTTSLQTLDKLKSLGLRIRSVGQVDLLPSGLRAELAELEAATSDDPRERTCLACIGYSSRHQIVLAALDMAKGVKAGTISSEDVTAEFLDAYVTDIECPDVDMLVRCAGRRLNDYMIMQSGYAYLNMNRKLWVDVSFWDWIWALLSYQLHWPRICKVKEKHLLQLASQSGMTDARRAHRQRSFIKSLQVDRIAKTLDQMHEAHLLREGHDTRYDKI